MRLDDRLYVLTATLTVVGLLVVVKTAAGDGSRWLLAFLSVCLGVVLMAALTEYTRRRDRE